MERRRRAERTKTARCSRSIFWRDHVAPLPDAGGGQAAAGGSAAGLGRVLLRHDGARGRQLLRDDLSHRRVRQHHHHLRVHRRAIRRAAGRGPGYASLRRQPERRNEPRGQRFPRGSRRRELHDPAFLRGPGRRHSDRGPRRRAGRISVRRDFLRRRCRTWAPCTASMGPAASSRSSPSMRLAARTRRRLCSRSPPASCSAPRAREAPPVSGRSIGSTASERCPSDRFLRAG